MARQLGFANGEDLPRLITLTLPVGELFVERTAAGINIVLPLADKRFLLRQLSSPLRQLLLIGDQLGLRRLPDRHVLGELRFLIGQGQTALAVALLNRLTLFLPGGLILREDGALLIGQRLRSGLFGRQLLLSTSNLCCLRFNLCSTLGQFFTLRGNGMPLRLQEFLGAGNVG